MDLLQLGGHQHAGHAEQLQVVPMDGSLGEKAVKQVYSEVKRVVSELEVAVDVDQPVDDGGSHLLSDVVLKVQQVVTARAVHFLR